MLTTMRLITYIVLIIFSTGIANAEAPQTVAGWRGFSMNSLIKNWGSPDVTIRNANGNTVLIYHVQTYKTYNRQYSPAVGVNVTPQGRAVITTPSMNPYSNPESLSLTCTIKFVANKRGTIISTAMQGSGCTSDQIHP